MAILKITLDLETLLKKAEPDRRKRVAFTPFINNDAAKREFGKQVIDHILDRTNKGRDKRGNRFKGYSKAYKESLEFQVYQKTNTVNLKLTGEMQSAIDVIDVDGPRVTIGFIDDTEERKALGHVNGSGPLPVRDFWGITEAEQFKIFKGIIRDVTDEIEVAELISETSEIIEASEEGTFPINPFIEDDDE